MKIIIKQLLILILFIFIKKNILKPDNREFLCLVRLVVYLK